MVTFIETNLLMEVVRHMQLSSLNRAVGQLVVVAFFFAIRSCKYLDVESRRRTTVVQVRDVNNVYD